MIISTHDIDIGIGSELNDEENTPLILVKEVSQIIKILILLIFE